MPIRINCRAFELCIYHAHATRWFDTFNRESKTCRANYMLRNEFVLINSNKWLFSWAKSIIFLCSRSLATLIRSFIKSHNNRVCRVDHVIWFENKTFRFSFRRFIANMTECRARVLSTFLSSPPVFTGVGGNSMSEREREAYMWRMHFEHTYVDCHSDNN